MKGIRGATPAEKVALFALMAAAAFALTSIYISSVPVAHAQTATLSPSAMNATLPVTPNIRPILNKTCGYTCGYYGSCPAGPSKSAGICERGTNGCYACVYSHINPGTTKYNITFSETGLPNGTTWSVVLNGVDKSSNGTAIKFSEYDGSYQYSINRSGVYVAANSSGSLLVDGANISKPVKFQPQGCLVGAPDGYCGYSSCPSGYTCASRSSPQYIGSLCIIGTNPSSGYATGTCQTNSSGKTTPPPVAVGSCGYLPSNLATIITSNENWYCPINYYTAQVWSKYLPLALVAVLLAFVIAALIIMVGIAAKSDSLRNFGMGEFLEATASAITVLVFLYISAVMFGLFPGSLVGPINPYATAFHLINSTISSTQSIYSNIFSIYAPAAFYVSMSTNIETIGGSSGIGGAAGKILKLTNSAVRSPFSAAVGIFLLEPSQVLASMLTDAAALLYAEYFLIAFFAIAAIPVFLVPGVIFRALLPTRALGGILMAMAMGFYLVMPTLFALAYYFTAPQLGTQLSILSATLNQFGSGTGSQINALTPTSPLATTLSGVESAMGSYWLLILFYPSLIIAVTYLFIVQVSQIIGGASYGIGRARGFI